MVTVLVFLLQSIAPVFVGATAASADRYTHYPDVYPTDHFMLAEIMRVIDEDPEIVVRPL